jgi:hypothetical protein
MVGACSTREERNAYIISLENLKVRDHFRDGVVGRIILK